MFDKEKADRFQSLLSLRLVLSSDFGKIQNIAGADCHYDVEGRLVGAVVAVLKYPELELIEAVTEIQKANIPYVPGYLSFREGPPLKKAFLKLKTDPDVTLIDGNGIAHPRRMGLASYVGILLDRPTIGCAKSPSFPYIPPSVEKGSFSLYLDNKGEKVGYCLRTRFSVQPIFVSPGHRMDFESARNLVLDCCKYRIPEPLRRAHHLAKGLFPAEGG